MSDTKKAGKKTPPKKDKKGAGGGGKSEGVGEQEAAIGEALRALNPRHRKFIEIYCTNGFNGTAAARAAGYSEKSARQQASALLTNPAVLRAREALLTAAHMSPAELVKRISEDATSSMEPFLRMTQSEIGGVPCVVPTLDLTTPQAKAALRHIRKIEFRPGKYGDTISIQLVDDQRAKEQLARIHKLFVDRQEVVLSDALKPESYIPDNGRGPKEDA